MRLRVRCDTECKAVRRRFRAANRGEMSVSGLLGRAAQFGRTVRHLNARQIRGRLAMFVLSPRPEPVHSDVRTTPFAPRILDSLARLGPTAGANEASTNAVEWLNGRVSGLGLNVPWTGDWRMAGPSPLWRYHLPRSDKRHSQYQLFFCPQNRSQSCCIPLHQILEIIIRCRKA